MGGGGGTPSSPGPPGYPPPSRPGQITPPPPSKPSWGGTPHHPDLGWGTSHSDLRWGTPHPNLRWSTPHPDLGWDNPPPPQTWDGVPPPPRKCEQTENITFSHPSDEGGKNYFYCIKLHRYLISRLSTSFLRLVVHSFIAFLKRAKLKNVCFQCMENILNATHFRNWLPIFSHKAPP